ARALGADCEVESNVNHLAICSTPGRSPDASLPQVETPATGGPPTLKILEGQAIVQVLRESRGNRTQAIRALGIDRSTLRRKLQELDNLARGRTDPSAGAPREPTTPVHHPQTRQEQQADQQSQAPGTQRRHNGVRVRDARLLGDRLTGQARDLE